MAKSYMLNFWVNLVIGGVELLAAGLCVLEMPTLAYVWVPSAGYWGGIFLYTLSPIFAMVHMTKPEAEGGLNAVAYSEDYSNDMFLMTVGMLGWAFSTVTHLLWTERYMAHVRAVYPGLELVDIALKRKGGFFGGVSVVINGVFEKVVKEDRGMEIVWKDGI